MIQRCEYPKATRFERWGGRGIKVCKEWHDSTSFINWALKAGYKDNLSLDRINNDRIMNLIIVDGQLFPNKIKIKNRG
jgi:hypothetical protein